MWVPPEIMDPVVQSPEPAAVSMAIVLPFSRVQLALVTQEPVTVTPKRVINRAILVALLEAA